MKIFFLKLRSVTACISKPIVVFSFLSLVALGLVVYGINPKINLGLSNNSIPSLLSRPKAQTINLTSIESYKNLPVAKVLTNNVDDAWGTVIFLPQYHKSSVNKSNDNINNIAAQTQKELYQILNYLVNNAGIDFTMIEGNLFGEVPTLQIAKLADKIEKRNQLLALYEKLKKALNKNSVNPSLEKELLETINATIARVDKDIILSGAPRKLKAEGNNIILYGAEDKQLHEKGLEIFQDYSYLSERVKQLSSKNKPQKKETSKITKLVFNKSSEFTEFNTLELQAQSQGKYEIVALLKQAEQALNAITGNDSKIQKISSSKKASSKEEDKEKNPYQNITNEKELRKKLADAQKGMQEVIINERNVQTAKNFADALRKENKSIGVLQFGAGHEKGLINELNRQGLSVITIKPQEVFKHLAS